MKRHFWFVLLVAGSLCLVKPAPGHDAFCKDDVVVVDLAKVDRTIVKEPGHRSKPPQYCLLVFGPEAKSRMWLVTDGNVLHVDRNATGDWRQYTSTVSQPKDGSWRAESWRVGDVVQAGSKYFDFEVVRTSWGGCFVRAKRYVKAGPRGRETAVLVDYATGSDYGSPVMGREQQRLVFGDTPDKAPILHFGGPLSLRVRLTADRKYLVRGSKPHLRVYAGTPGLGEGTFTSIYADLPERGSWNRAVSSSATIRFPAKDGGRQGPKHTFEMGG